MKFDIRDHGVGLGASLGIKFTNVICSLTRPLSPKNYDIWVETADPVSKIDFTDDSIEPSEVGHLTINFSGIINILSPLIKQGGSQLKAASVPTRSTSRKIMESSLLTVYGDIGVVKYRSTSTQIKYLNAHVFFNGNWIQTSVDSDSGFGTFYRKDGSYYFAFVDQNDNVTSHSAVWSNDTISDRYGYSPEVFYHPVFRAIVAAGTNGSGGGQAYLIRRDLPLHPVNNFEEIVNWNGYSVCAMSRDHIFMSPSGMNSGGNTLRVANIHTKKQVFSNTTSTNSYYLPHMSSYIDRYKIFVSANHYGTIVAYDASNVDSGVLPKIYENSSYDFRGPHSSQVVVDKNGIMTFNNVGDSRFYQFDHMFNLVKTGAAANGAVSAFTHDRDGNLYYFHDKTLVKLDSNFNEVWRITTGHETHYASSTKENIIYAYSYFDGIKKYNTEGQLISTIPGIQFVNSNTSMATFSPKMSAFPEYW